MLVFFNERCLTERDEFPENIVYFLNQHLDRLYKSKIKVFSKLDDIKNWIEKWSDVDTQLEKGLLTAIKNVYNCEENSEQFYYYHFRHQDFVLGLSENISTASISIAANRMMQNQKVAVLTVPISLYSKRPNIAVIKSPYDSKYIDILVNIPNFNTGQEIINFFLLINEIEPQLGKDFERFKIEYLDFYQEFNKTNWEPKTIIKSMLSSELAFPALQKPFLKEKISNLKIRNMDYETNKANYMRLGGAILELHGYVKNTRISNLYDVDVYEAGVGNAKLLICIDEENGAFEVCEGLSGDHLGAYKYSGEVQKKYTNRNELRDHSLTKEHKHLFLYD